MKKEFKKINSYFIMFKKSKEKKVRELFSNIIYKPEVSLQDLFSINIEDFEGVNLVKIDKSDKLSPKQFLGVQLMVFSDLNQSEIARALDLHRSTISKWKNEDDDFSNLLMWLKLIEEMEKSSREPPYKKEETETKNSGTKLLSEFCSDGAP